MRRNFLISFGCIGVFIMLLLLGGKQLSEDNKDEAIRLELLEIALTSQNPEGIAHTWAWALQSRNASLAYAIESDELREASFSSYSQVDWIIPGSSPWIDAYSILDVEELDDGNWRFVMQYHYTDSTGYSNYKTQHLLVTPKIWSNTPSATYDQTDNYWCVLDYTNLH